MALKDVVGARNRQRRALRQQLKDRHAVAEQLLEFRQGHSAAVALLDQAQQPMAKGPKIKRYRNE